MKQPRIALVHDYLKEYGGAEQVLKTLHEMFPEAPIYTAFLTPASTAEKEFAGAKIITSWANWLVRHKNLHSPLRFLIPFIWESFDFSNYDVVILSSSGYLTKPVRIPKKVKVICYCHTPPRFLYGYQTQLEWQRYLLIKIYGNLLGHFLRLYDFLGAKRVDQFVANSDNIAKRIQKFYRKESVVIYPPVQVQRIKTFVNHLPDLQKGEFFLWVGRIVGGKGLPMIMDAFNSLRKESKYKDYRLKIVGEPAGLRWEEGKINKRKSTSIEFLGRVSDEELIQLYATCKAFVVAEKDVDFGIVQIEAMAAGAPVVAPQSGGYLETIVEGKTGTFFEDYSVEALADAMKRIASLRIKKTDCQKQAEKFSKERFVKGIQSIIEKHA